MLVRTRRWLEGLVWRELWDMAHLAHDLIISIHFPSEACEKTISSNMEVEKDHPELTVSLWISNFNL